MLALTLAAPASARPALHHPARAEAARPPGASWGRQRIRLDAQQALAARALAAKALAAKALAARIMAGRTAGELAAAQRQAVADETRAASLSAATVAAATRVQQTERGAADASDQVRALAMQQAAAHSALAADAAALAPLLPVIERLSLYPSETLLAAPASPDRAVTGLMVLRGLGASIEQRARALREEQARLAVIGTQLGRERTRLEALQRHQAEQQLAVAARAQAAQARQRASGAEADQAARAAADAAARAANLGDAVARIEAAERAAEAQFQREAAQAEVARQPETARQARASAASLAVPAGPGLAATGGGTGTGPAPVAGRIVHRFGDPTDAGPATGLTYAPPSLATVTAPCTGRVDFAGPFRSYGRMLILDCGHDYRFVLAGLDRLDVAVGQSLARGAAVGRMPASGDSASAPSGSGSGSLYVQLRHAGDTIDPGRFLLHPR